MDTRYNLNRLAYFVTIVEEGTITAADYGVSFVGPLIGRFQQKYPRVEVDLMLSDDQQDIIEQRFDVAFRIGWLKDSSNLARKLHDFNEIAGCVLVRFRYFWKWCEMS